MNIPSGRPPWLENIKTTERLVRDTWRRNEALQNAMLDEFIKDTLHAEIVGIVSSTLTVMSLTILCIKLFQYSNEKNSNRSKENRNHFHWIFDIGEPIETQR